MTESDIIDIETINSLKSVLDDDIFELFKEFILDGPTAIERIEKAITENNIPEINKAAHYLKGSAGNIGAIGLSNACRNLELQAKNNELQNANQQLDQIKMIYSQTVQFMENQEA